MLIQKIITNGLNIVRKMLSGIGSQSNNNLFDSIVISNQAKEVEHQGQSAKHSKASMPNCEVQYLIFSIQTYR